MRPFDTHSGTLFLLMERLSPVGEGTERTLVLHSRAEYDAIPGQWHFQCYGAFFRLKEKRWSADTGRGTVTLEMW